MTPPDSTQPVTFRELLEGATAGPWVSIKADAYQDFTHIFISSSRGAIGFSPATDDATLGYTRFREVDADYIARLSPTTMRLVLDALNACAEVDGDTEHQKFKITRFQAAQHARRALHALNGNQTNT